MKNFIKKRLREELLKEEMVSMIDEWRQNMFFIAEDSLFNTLISKDNQNGNKLYLFVGFNHRNGFSDYSYSFILLDKNDKPLTKYMTVRDEVKKYLPKNLINNRQIFPIIKELTRELLQKMTPEEIHRHAVESINGTSLLRYDEITKIFVNEFGYKDATDSYLRSKNIWKLIKNENNEKNSTLNEHYVLGSDEELRSYIQGIGDMVYSGLKAMQEGRVQKIYDENGNKLI